MSEPQGSEGTTRRLPVLEKPAEPIDRPRRATTTRPATARHGGPLLVRAPRPGRRRRAAARRLAGCSCTTSPPCGPTGPPWRGAASSPGSSPSGPSTTSGCWSARGVAAVARPLAARPRRHAGPARRCCRCAATPRRRPGRARPGGRRAGPARPGHGGLRRAVGTGPDGPPQGRRARASSHFRELDDVRADLDAALGDGDPGSSGLARPPAPVRACRAGTGDEGVRRDAQDRQPGPARPRRAGAARASAARCSPSGSASTGRPGGSTTAGTTCCSATPTGTRWRDEGWWWPTVIAVLAVLVLLALWWLSPSLRRAPAGRGPGRHRRRRGRAAARPRPGGRPGARRTRLDGVARAHVAPDRPAHRPEARVRLLLEPHVDPGMALDGLTDEALAHAARPRRALAVAAGGGRA